MNKAGGDPSYYNTLKTVDSSSAHCHAMGMAKRVTKYDNYDPIQ